MSACSAVERLSYSHPPEAISVFPPTISMAEVPRKIVQIASLIHTSQYHDLVKHSISQARLYIVCTLRDHTSSADFFLLQLAKKARGSEEIARKRLEKCEYKDQHPSRLKALLLVTLYVNSSFTTFTTQSRN